MGLIQRSDRLYIAGLESDACVLATLFDLWDAGFSFRVYRQGIGTNRTDLAEPTLALIRRQFGAEIFVQSRAVGPLTASLNGKTPQNLCTTLKRTGESRFPSGKGRGKSWVEAVKILHFDKSHKKDGVK